MRTVLGVRPVPVRWRENPVWIPGQSRTRRVRVAFWATVLRDCRRTLCPILLSCRISSHDRVCSSLTLLLIVHSSAKVPGTYTFQRWFKETRGLLQGLDLTEGVSRCSFSVSRVPPVRLSSNNIVTSRNPRQPVGHKRGSPGSPSPTCDKG